MNQQKIWIPVVVVVVLIIVGGIFFFRSRPASTLSTATGSEASSTSATSTSSTASTTTTDLGNGITVTGPAGAKVTLTPVPTVKAPSLNHQVAYSSDVPPEAKAAIGEQIASTTAQLKSNASNGNAWLQLAIDYKMAGDYTAAESVWTYMTKVIPSNSVAYIDLGDLYQNFLKNYPKAESNYLQAVKLDPKNIDTYRNLYTLYRYQYKTNTSAAADILAQGLKANPNNQDLLNLQSQLQSGK